MTDIYLNLVLPEMPLAERSQGHKERGNAQSARWQEMLQPPELPAAELPQETEASHRTPTALDAKFSSEIRQPSLGVIATAVPLRFSCRDSDALIVPMNAVPVGRISFFTPQHFDKNPVVLPAAISNRVKHATIAGPPYTTNETIAVPATTISEHLISTVVDRMRQEARPHNKVAIATSNTTSQATVNADWLARRLQLLVRDGEVEIRLRDYRLSPDEITTLIEALVENAYKSGEPLRKITVNGHVAWQLASKEHEND